MKKIILGLVSLLVLVFVLRWGKIEILPASTITVTGEAKNEQSPQIARFSATVVFTNQNKQTAVDLVNQSMAKIIQSVKDFGIDQKDIQTQQVSVYQTKEERLSTKDAWQASNSISITLRDIAKASALADLLAASGATNVSGPNYSLDDTTQAQADLLSKAIDNAREKAGKIAVSSGRKLGKVITVSESGTTPVYRGLNMAASEKSVPTPVEPGTETVYKSVTVTFELK